jgi:hypothetical protein
MRFSGVKFFLYVPFFYSAVSLASNENAILGEYVNRVDCKMAGYCRQLLVSDPKLSINVVAENYAEAAKIIENQEQIDKQISELNKRIQQRKVEINRFVKEFESKNGRAPNNGNERLAYYNRLTQAAESHLQSSRLDAQSLGAELDRTYGENMGKAQSPTTRMLSAYRQSLTLKSAYDFLKTSVTDFDKPNQVMSRSGLNKTAVSRNLSQIIRPLKGFDGPLDAVKPTNVDMVREVELQKKYPFRSMDPEGQAAERLALEEKIVASKSIRNNILSPKGGASNLILLDDSDVQLLTDISITSRGLVNDKGLCDNIDIDPELLAKACEEIQCSNNIFKFIEHRLQQLRQSQAANISLKYEGELCASNFNVSVDGKEFGRLKPNGKCTAYNCEFEFNGSTNENKFSYKFVLQNSELVPIFTTVKCYNSDASSNKACSGRLKDILLNRSGHYHGMTKNQRANSEVVNAIKNDPAFASTYCQNANADRKIICSIAMGLSHTQIAMGKIANICIPNKNESKTEQSKGSAATK